MIAGLLRSPVGARLVFFVLAGLIGVLVGFATLALMELLRLVQQVGYGTGVERGLAAAIDALPAWRVVLVPTVGGLVVGVLLRYVPDQRYHGIADVMEACAMNSARMPVRSGLGAALAAGISLGVGAPLGREGPAVHIGASLSAWLAERLRLDHKQSLALLGCGAAAAVAVSFNTPIAAVIFALEVIVGYYTLRVFAPVVIAVMLAMVVRESVLGSAPMFWVPPHDVDAVRELPLFALLGVCGAIVARVLIGGIERVERLWRFCHVPRWLQPALGGALIGLVATKLPLVLGIGIEGTALALAGSLAVGLVAALLLAKLLVFAIALGSGFAGGVFGPAVFIGAMLGSLFWWLADALGLPLVAGPGVYAAIGMAATGSALLGAPISTVLIVFELTRDYGITLGVMTAAAVASTTMQFGTHASFFRWQLARRDVNISAGRDISLLVTQRCKRLISTRFVTVPETITCGELESRMGAERQRLAMFVDADGAFRGSVNLSSLIGHAIEHGLQSSAIGAAEDSAFSISPSTNIVSAVQTMAERQLEYVPVVEPLGGAVAVGAAGTVARAVRERILERSGEAARGKADGKTGVMPGEAAVETAVGKAGESAGARADGKLDQSADGKASTTSRGKGGERPDERVSEGVDGEEAGMAGGKGDEESAGARVNAPLAESREGKRWRLLGVVLKSDLLAEHYDVVKRAREEEFGIT